jgi:hypothetical protein
MRVDAHPPEALIPSRGVVQVLLDAVNKYRQRRPSLNTATAQTYDRMNAGVNVWLPTGNFEAISLSVSSAASITVCRTLMSALLLSSNKVGCR